MQRVRALLAGLFLCMLLICSADRPAQATTFVLVHGAWHGAWCWEKVLPFLAEAGHTVVAIDLPGYGLEARLPKSFLQRPLDPAAFAKEPSPVAGVTLQAMADTVMRTIDAVMRGGSGPVILVGHSMGGVPITLAGEMAPEKTKKIVYLAALMPESNVPAGAYMNAPEQKDALVLSLAKANPREVGASRIDPRSTDPAYRTMMKKAFYGDVDDATFEMAAQFLTPDLPFQQTSTSIKTTEARWGSIKRVYIMTSDDYAVRPALQKLLIGKADAFVPNNKTEVIVMDSSHSPFLSKPEELARILIGLAK